MTTTKPLNLMQKADRLASALQQLEGEYRREDRPNTADRVRTVRIEAMASPDVAARLYDLISSHKTRAEALKALTADEHSALQEVQAESRRVVHPDATDDRLYNIDQIATKALGAKTFQCIGCNERVATPDTRCELCATEG